MYIPIHFDAKELACHCCGVCGCTEDFLQALDQLRENEGRRVFVHDAYRCEKHNLAVGGVAHSEHPQGEAGDISIEGYDTRQMYDAAMRVEAFARGGIGLYDHGNFIHVDVRANGPARWARVNGKYVGISALLTGDTVTGANA